MASITDVARLAGVSTATVVAGRLGRADTRSARPPARGCSTRRGRSTTSRTRSPAGCSRATSRSSASSSTTSPTRTSPRSCAASRTRRASAATWSSPAARIAIAERESSYVRLLRSMRAATVIFAGSGLDDPALNDGGGQAPRRDARVWRGRRPPLAARLGDAGDRRRQRGRDRGDGRGAGRAGPSADRVPRRPGLAVRRARAAGRLPARPRRGRASRTTSGSSCAPGSTRTAARSASTRCSPAKRRSRPSAAANDLLALGALQRLAELGIDGPGGGLRRRASTTSRPRRWPRPSLSTVRLPLHEIGRRGFGFAERPARRRRARGRGAPDRARHARVDRARRRPARSSARPARRGRRRSADGRSAGGSGRPGHRQQPRHRRRGGRQGRRRGGRRRRPLPPRRRTARRPRWRRSATPAPTARPSTPTSPTGGRPASWSSG